MTLRNDWGIDDWFSADDQNDVANAVNQNTLDIAAASAALAGKADKTITISAGAGLTGGGNLSANRALAVVFGNAAGTVAQGNDARLSDPRVPIDGSVQARHLETGATGTAGDWLYGNLSYWGDNESNLTQGDINGSRATTKLSFRSTLPATGEAGVLYVVAP